MSVICQRGSVLDQRLSALYATGKPGHIEGLGDWLVLSCRPHRDGVEWDLVSP